MPSLAAIIYNLRRQPAKRQPIVMVDSEAGLGSRRHVFHCVGVHCSQAEEKQVTNDENEETTNAANAKKWQIVCAVFSGREARMALERFKQTRQGWRKEPTVPRRGRRRSRVAEM